jgi:hypothetical protein
MKALIDVDKTFLIIERIGRENSGHFEAFRASS